MLSICKCVGWLLPRKGREKATNQPLAAHWSSFNISILVVSLLGGLCLLLAATSCCSMAKRTTSLPVISKIERVKNPTNEWAWLWSPLPSSSASLGCHGASAFGCRRFYRFIMRLVLAALRHGWCLLLRGPRSCLLKVNKGLLLIRCLCKLTLRDERLVRRLCVIFLKTHRESHSHCEAWHERHFFHHQKIVESPISLSNESKNAIHS